MTHIRKEVQRVLKKGKHIVTVCGAKLADADTLTETALASDCNTCRGLVGVGGKNEKTWDGVLLGVRPAPVLTPNAELLRDADGNVYKRIKP